MLSSLAESTIKQYEGPLRSWHNFCRTFNKNDFRPSATDVLHYLQELLIRKASYGTINTHRSALSLISHDKIGEHPLISRFLKGVFRSKPPEPKYRGTWDVDIVLEMLKKSYPLADLPLRTLAEKLAMLLLITTAHRLQTITSITLDDLIETGEGYWIKMSKMLKTTRPGSASTTLFVPRCQEIPELCVYSVLKEYIRQTQELRGETRQLFITTNKPHKAASKDTVSKWIKHVLSESGIDTKIFSAHSTRHASTSSAYLRGVNIDVIRRTAGWSKNSSTFQRFYNVPVLTDDQRVFSQSLLRKK